MTISKPVRLSIRGGRQNMLAEPDETLAETLERHDEPLWLACRNGVCEICETALLRGRVRQHFPAGEFDGRADGTQLIRLCTATATDDVEIAPPRQRRRRVY